jgi:hypothetical protein
MFGIVSLLIALVLGGAMWAMNARTSGPSSQTAQRAETQAQVESASINFSQASLQLETFHAENGTYVGAVLPASFGATLVRADASSYCLQAGAGTALQHLVGPGGQAAAGPC